MRLLELFEATGKAAVAQAQRDAQAAIAKKKRDDAAKAEQDRLAAQTRQNELLAKWKIQNGEDLMPNRPPTLSQHRQDQLTAHGIAQQPVPNTPAANNFFDAPEFQQYQYVPDDDAGVALRFEVDKHPATGNPVVFAYWTHSKTPSFADAKGLGTIQSVGEVYSPQTTALITRLIQDEGAVMVLIGPKIAKQFPKEVKNLEKWVQKKEDKAGYEGFLYFEYDDEAPAKPASNAVAAAPTAALNIPNAVELQQQIMVALRKDKELYSRYEAASSAQRKAALDAAVKYFYKAKDLEGALDEVDVAL
jgi:hypothetical protein